MKQKTTEQKLAEAEKEIAELKKKVSTMWNAMVKLEKVVRSVDASGKRTKHDVRVVTTDVAGIKRKLGGRG